MRALPVPKSRPARAVASARFRSSLLSVKFGLYGLHKGENTAPEALTRRAREAEEAGFESIWVGDHIALPPDDPDDAYDPRLEARRHARAPRRRDAARPARLRRDVLPQRQPVLLAKQLTSIDVLSEGRLIVGFGVGYLEAELRALGATLADRGARTDEYLAAMRALWDEPTPDFEGRFVSFSNVIQRPRPVQRPHPPIVIGGDSPAAYRRARAADGWYGWEQTPEQVGDDARRLRAGLEITITPAPPGPIDPGARAPLRPGRRRPAGPAAARHDWQLDGRPDRRDRRAHRQRSERPPRPRVRSAQIAALCDRFGSGFELNAAWRAPGHCTMPLPRQDSERRPEGRVQAAQARLERVHVLLAEQLGPGLADVGDGLARGRSASRARAVGMTSFARPSVGSGSAGHVAEPLELVDSMDDGRLGQHGPLGQLGDPRSRRADVLADREQRRTRSAKPRRASSSATSCCMTSVGSRKRLPKLSVPLGGRRGRKRST